MFVAYRQCVSEGRRPTMAWMRFAVGLVLFVLANDWFAVEGDWLLGGGRFYVVLFPLVLCLGASLMLEALLSQPRAPASVPGMRALQFVGVISYSLYLYHVGIQVVVFRFIRLDAFSFTAKSLLYAAISLGPAMLAAWVMYRLVEEPAMRLGARYRDGKRQRGPEPVATTGPLALALR